MVPETWERIGKEGKKRTVNEFSLQFWLFFRDGHGLSPSQNSVQKQNPISTDDLWESPSCAFHICT